MIGIGKNNKVKKLRKRYSKLLEEAYNLSRVNRKLSDSKYAEAERLIAEIDKYNA